MGRPALPSGGPGGARSAHPEQHQLVARDAQPTRQGHILQERQGTPDLEFEDRMAPDASEVVMVAPARGLVARGVARKVYRDDLTVALELPEVPIHGGEPDPLDFLPGTVVEFLRGERAGGVLESLEDGPSLRGSALHGRIVAGAPRDERAFSLPSVRALTERAAKRTFEA